VRRAVSRPEGGEEDVGFEHGTDHGRRISVLSSTLAGCTFPPPDCTNRPIFCRIEAVIGAIPIVGQIGDGVSSLWPYLRKSWGLGQSPKTDFAPDISFAIIKSNTALIWKRLLSVIHTAFTKLTLCFCFSVDRTAKSYDETGKIYDVTGKKTAILRYEFGNHLRYQFGRVQLTISLYA
jgi:hypothetical protein